MFLEWLFFGNILNDLGGVNTFDLVLVYQVLWFSFCSFFLKKPIFAFVSLASQKLPYSILTLDYLYKLKSANLNFRPWETALAHLTGLTFAHLFLLTVSLQSLWWDILAEAFWKSKYTINKTISIFHHSVPSCFALVDENKIFLVY